MNAWKDEKNGRTGIHNDSDRLIFLEDDVIVSQYFLHQRVKPTTADNEEAYRKYLKQLESLHHVLVFAMKSKQSTDLSIIDTMREKVHIFEHAYFEEHKH